MNKAILILPFIIFSLLAALWGGVIRIGWVLPAGQVSVHHGGIMVTSFLASLIFLERAVSFKSRWPLLVPLVNALSLIPFLLEMPSLGHLFTIAGSVGFIGICIYFVYKHKHFYYYIFLVASVSLAAGNIILYYSNVYAAASPLWMAFLLFTIVAERMELSRFLPLSNFKKALLGIFLLCVFAALFIPFHKSGAVYLGAAFILTSVWLMLYDMARLSIKAKGQHKYSGWLLLIGFAWLLISGVLMFFETLVFWYDAVLHSFFIGFVFSMIFSHAPIIFPAVLKLPIKIYRPVLYVWFWLLQLSLIARIYGDLKEDMVVRKVAGIVNGISILLFFASIAVIVVGELKKLKRTHFYPVIPNPARR